MTQLRRRLTYANVMSTIAVFLFLGSATALAASKIGSDQLKSGAVTTGKVAKEAVKTGKIANDAVTGKKVKESSLGEVPSASDATTLDGIGASAFTRVAGSSTEDTVLDGVEGTARTVGITAPQRGYLFIVASGNVSNGGTTKTFTDCRLNLDGADIPGTRRSAYTSEEVPKSDCATNAIVPVTAGPHTVNYTFGVVSPDMDVEWVGLDVAFAQLPG